MKHDNSAPKEQTKNTDVLSVLNCWDLTGVLIMNMTFESIFTQAKWCTKVFKRVCLVCSRALHSQRSLWLASLSPRLQKSSPQWWDCTGSVDFIKGKPKLLTNNLTNKKTFALCEIYLCFWRYKMISGLELEIWSLGEIFGVLAKTHMKLNKFRKWTSF